MWKKLEEIESKYDWELNHDDWINNTYIDYLKSFFDSTMIEQQTFCLSGQKKLTLRENLADDEGLCYTITNQEGIFNKKT